MVIHASDRFETIVAALNQAFAGLMVFQLIASLVEGPANQHDADFVVHPKLPFDMKVFSNGCKDGGMEVVSVDETLAAMLANGGGLLPGHPHTTLFFVRGNKGSENHGSCEHCGSFESLPVVFQKEV